jgi:RIO-like serine/threonine protein kinase
LVDSHNFAYSCDWPDCNKNEHYTFGYELQRDVQMCKYVDVQMIGMGK